MVFRKIKETMGLNIQTYAMIALSNMFRNIQLGKREITTIMVTIARLILARNWKSDKQFTRGMVLENVENCY